MSGSPSTSHEGSGPTGVHSSPRARSSTPPPVSGSPAIAPSRCYEYRTTQSLKSVLDVAGYTLGTFVLDRTSASAHHPVMRCH